MKVNLNQAFKSYDGSDLIESAEVERFGKKVIERKPVMIADSLAMNLYMGTGLVATGDPLKDNAEKFQAFKLCQRIMNTKIPINLEAEELALIKKVAAAAFAPGTYGQVVELIECKEEKEEQK